MVLVHFQSLESFVDCSNRICHVVSGDANLSFLDALRPATDKLPGTGENVLYEGIYIYVPWITTILHVFYALLLQKITTGERKNHRLFDLRFLSC